MDGTEESDLGVRDEEAKLLTKVLTEYRAKLRDRRNPPKGMTYGDVEDALENSKSLLEKLKAWA